MKAALEEILAHIDALDPHIPDDRETLVRVINKIEDLAQGALGTDTAAEIDQFADEHGDQAAARAVAASIAKAEGGK